MPLSNQQVDSLLNLINSTGQDDMDCGSCFDHLAEYADLELSNREIPDAIKKVQSHLKQCPCCKDEFEALLEGLQELEQK